MPTPRLPRFARASIDERARQWAPYVLLSATVFLASVALGFAVGTGNGAATMLPIAPTGSTFRAPDAPALFVHNAIVSLQLAGGVLLAGLPTLYLTGYNGFALGHAISSAASRFGVPTTIVLLAPHGVFELPAICLAAATSARWVHVLARVATATRRRQPVAITFVETSVVLALAAVLLAIAALVEAHVTPALANAIASVAVEAP